MVRGALGGLPLLGLVQDRGHVLGLVPMGGAHHIGVDALAVLLAVEVVQNDVLRPRQRGCRVHRRRHVQQRQL